MITDNPRRPALIWRGMTRRDFVRAGLGAMAAPALIGCSNSTEPNQQPPNQTASTRLTAKPGTPSKAPLPGFSALSFGDVRDGFMYVPPGYDPGTPIPLLVALHGSVSSSSFWMSYEGRAEARGFAMLAPDSRQGTWDIVEGGYGPDIAFIDRALTYTFDRVNVDPARISLLGFSDGASYAISVGVSNGDLFRNLVSHSPGFFIPAEPIVGKPRIFISHGTQDQILPVAVTRDQIVPNFVQAGYEVEYNEFDGGHEIPDAIADQAFDWWLGPTPSS